MGYVFLGAKVSGDGVYPLLSECEQIDLGTLGNIFGPDGAMLSDADLLHSIAIEAAALRTPIMEYSDDWIAWTVVPKLKNNRLIMDEAAADYGLDWDWLQVSAPGTANDVTNTQFTDFTIAYNMQGGARHITSIFWAYTLEAPMIDGFMVFRRVQPHFWQWSLSASWSNINTDKPTLDTATGGGADAWSSLVTALTRWKAKGVEYCYFHVTDGSANTEIVKLDITATVIAGIWVFSRGQEGTSSLTWSSGALFSFFPSAYTDTSINITDTTSRSVTGDVSLPVTYAMHACIVAVKLTGNSTWKRSYYYPIQSIVQEG